MFGLHQESIIKLQLYYNKLKKIMDQRRQKPDHCWWNLKEDNGWVVLSSVLCSMLPRQNQNPHLRHYNGNRSHFVILRFN